MSQKMIFVTIFWGKTKFLKNRNIWQTCTICISNESRKNVEFNYDTQNYICDHFWGENKIFKIFASILTRFFFSKFKIFKKIFIQPPKFITYTYFKHQKWKLHGGLTLLALCHAEWRGVKHDLSWFLPPRPI